MSEKKKDESPEIQTTQGNTGGMTQSKLAIIAKALTAGMAELTDSNNTLSKKLDDVESSGKTTRRIVWGTVGSVAFDIILSLVVAILAVETKHAVDTANDSVHKQVLSCNASNESRADNLTIWHKAFELFPADASSKKKKPLNPVQQTNTATFKALIEKTYAPRDCSKLLKPDVQLSDLRPTILPSVAPTK